MRERNFPECVMGHTPLSRFMNIAQADAHFSVSSIRHAQATRSLFNAMEIALEPHVAADGTRAGERVQKTRRRPEQFRLSTRYTHALGG